MNYYILIVIITLLLLLLEIMLHLGDGAILTASMNVLYNRYKDTDNIKKILELKNNTTKIAGIIIILSNISHQVINILLNISFIHYYGYKKWAYFSLAIGIFFAYIETFLKVASVEFPETIIYYLCRPFYLLYQLISPISSLVERFVLFQLNLFGIKRKISNDPVEEIQGAIGYHLDKIDQDHAHILKNAANLSNWSVLEIMQHRKNIITVGMKENFEDIIPLIINSHQEYIPVWQENEEDVIGFLDINLLLRKMVLEDYQSKNYDKDKKKRFIADYVQQPIFIYKKVTISKFLHMLNNEKFHGENNVLPPKDNFSKHEKVFFIVEEDGSFLGLVNRDNLSDAIIKNTSYSHITNIRKYKDGYIIPGFTTINNINMLLGFDLDTNYITITNLFLNNYSSNNVKVNYINFNKYKIILLSPTTSSKMFFYIEKRSSSD